MAGKDALLRTFADSHAEAGADEVAGSGDASSVAELRLPGRKWGLVLEAPGFEFDEEQHDAEGNKKIEGRNRGNGLMLTAFLERAMDGASAAICRDHYWEMSKNSPLPKSDIRMAEVNGIAIVYWTVESYEGQDIRQRNMNAYLGREGACVDVHVSKVQYRDKDASAFEAVLAGMSLR